MYKLIILLFSVSVIFSASYTFAQEPQLATFQESAQIIVDQTISKNITASITLQSTSIQEIRIPADLENKIRNTDKVVAIILTNEESCVLGVLDESCIMINISREGIEGGIIAIQDLGKEIGRDAPPGSGSPHSPRRARRRPPGHAELGQQDGRQIAGHRQGQRGRAVLPRGAGGPTPCPR